MKKIFSRIIDFAPIIAVFILVGLVVLSYYTWEAEAQTGSKVTELTEDTSPAGEDLLVTVDDPSGTPVNKKVTRTNLLGTQTKGFVIYLPDSSDDFLVWRSPAAITITNIYGVLLSGTNVVGGFDECDSNGTNCIAVDADISFDGNLDADDGTLANPSIDAGDWVRWHTTSVSAPGYLTVTVYYTID
jgi:hypothetical protein